MSQRRLSARDYKGVQRGGFDWQRWRELGIGLGLGLLVALIVYVSDHRASDPTIEVDPAARHPVNGNAARSAAGNAAANSATGGRTGAREASAGSPDADTNYAFYDLLPKYEVVVPEKEHGTHVDAAARVDRPGTYFLQAGSYRSETEAERVRAQLARQDINASVQRVQLDADVWFRTRVGPIKDLAQLNRLRQQLRAADIDSLVIRVED
ncbi:MAG: SPOR domain-containing protein [Steroidobacteraceae bacterium]